MYIGEKETRWLFVILITSQFFVGGMKIFAVMSAVSGLIFSLLCAVIALLIFLVTDKMSSGKSFFDIVQKTYGKGISASVGGVFTMLSLLNCAWQLNMFSEAVTDIILPDSPKVYIMMFFALVIFAVSFFGIEALTRYALPAGSMMIFIALLTAVFNFENLKFSNLYPLFGKGSIKFSTIKDTLIMFSNVFYLFVISDFFREKKDMKRVGIKALLISETIIAFFVFLYALLVPYHAGTNFDYPFFRLASLANSSVLFQRLDGVVYVVWLFGGFISVGTTALFTMLIFSKSFGISDYKGIMHIITFIIIALSVSYNRFSLSSFLFAAFVFVIVFITALINRLGAKRR